MRQPTTDELRHVLRLWDVSFAAERLDLDLTGSPERTEWRTAVEATDGTVYVLEQIAASKRDHRRRISATLQTLRDRGVPSIDPYLATAYGGAIGEADGTYWQLMPFIPGVSLPRPDYIWDEWRGEVLADWLVALRKGSDPLPAVKPDVFSVVDYYEGLLASYAQRLPILRNELQPFVEHLSKGGFVAAHAALPVAFCHGDYHHMNVIWAEDGLGSVLDWEFMGYKPEMYDVANMIGCAGMEYPEALLRGLVPAMLARLHESGIFAQESWRWFLDYLLALRFAWMREWVTREENEMVNLELDFMFILLDNRQTILEKWGVE
jgi:homoserine kinase type II